MSALANSRRRGSPLAMLALVLGSWIAARAALWESPFPLPQLPAADLWLAEAPPVSDRQVPPSIAADQVLAELIADPPLARMAVAAIGDALTPRFPAAQWQGYAPPGQRPAIAAGHSMLVRAAYTADWSGGGLGNTFGAGSAGTGRFAAMATSQPSFAAAPRGRTNDDAERWSLDVFTFYRAGSGALSTSQGRVPVYGASQVSAALQYRAAPTSRHDPRAFLRGYHALVNNGETELAAGLSARPLSALPLRLAGEVRAVDTPSGTDIRPAGYAVTELPVQRLPLRFALEAYGAVGYVGGDAGTYFAEGQTGITREVASIGGADSRSMRLSVGGAAWGGAQEDAQRLDVGPTMRLDLNLGTVPARLSIDWRERVAGDAAPDSGIAATVSTRF